MYVCTNPFLIKYYIHTIYSYIQAAIHGYSAYAPSKWALRGFAEVLQMELKPYNVYVSVSYPPDTDTPGYQVQFITLKTQHGIYLKRNIATYLLYTILYYTYLRNIIKFMVIAQ